MHELFYSVFTATSNPKLEEFIDIICRIKGLNSQAATARKMILDNFKEFTEQEVQVFALENGDKLLSHWMMIKKSNFNKKLWDKFIDVDKFSQGVVNNFITQELNQMTSEKVK